jgi:voltage-gated potassium channel
MTKNTHLRPAVILPKGRFMKLLGLLLGMLLMVPLMEEVFQVRALGEFFFSAVMCYATYSFNRNRRLLAAAGALALPAIVAIWLYRFLPVSWLAVCGNLFGMAFLAILTTAILIYIFSQEDIDADMIAGAIVAYLLMALMWSLIYGLIEAARPGSFQLADGTVFFRRELFTYFSLVTITTVGYGDVVPVTPVARAFANLEAVVGQLYLVILVSWMVGMYVSARSRRRP